MHGVEKSAEAIVIGGSVAGLFTAYHLAKGGASVELFDANDVMHVSPRTLIATARLTEVLGFFPSKAIVNHIRRIELISPGHSVTLDMIKPDLVVERAEIIRTLAHLALEAGVKIHSGCKFLGFAPSERGVAVRVQNRKQGRVEEFTTRSLVGADGAFSRVAAAADMNGLQRVPVLQAIVEVPNQTRAGTVQVWFQPAKTPFFYWLIPEASNRAAVGFIAQESKSAKATLEGFLASQDLKALEIQAAWIPLFTRRHPSWRRVAGCDIYLVGDAAGHVKVTTVGGLVTGLWGAKVAANAILGRADYDKELRSLHRELTLHHLIRSILSRFRSGDYDRLLSALNTGLIHLLGRYTRDELTKMVLQLIFAQPRLLSVLTHLLVPAKHPTLSSDPL